MFFFLKYSGYDIQLCAVSIKLVVVSEFNFINKFSLSQLLWIIIKNIYNEKLAEFNCFEGEIKMYVDSRELGVLQPMHLSC